MFCTSMEEIFLPQHLVHYLEDTFHLKFILPHSLHYNTNFPTTRITIWICFTSNRDKYPKIHIFSLTSDHNENVWHLWLKAPQQYKVKLNSNVSVQQLWPGRSKQSTEWADSCERDYFLGTDREPARTMSTFVAWRPSRLRCNVSLAFTEPGRGHDADISSLLIWRVC